MRVIKTLRSWGVYVDEAFFLGGVEKTKVLKALKPHIFYDDQDVHLIADAKIVPSGKVPYASKSELAEREASRLSLTNRLVIKAEWFVYHTQNNRLTPDQYTPLNTSSLCHSTNRSPG